MPGMTTLFSGLAVAFVAVCIWLTVRIVNRREKWAKRMLAAVIAAPLLYVLSFGPACWWFDRRLSEVGAELNAAEMIAVPYIPLGRLARFEPDIIGDALLWYAMVGTPTGNETVIPVGWQEWHAVAR
jgi:hypothetical protein